jgi:eukaryotic-like serine/threonine-protein kinase
MVVNVSCTPLTRVDPTSVGRYALLGRLGAGGMGTVYLGRDSTGSTVAVKLLHKRLARDPEFLARFAAEAAAARRVAGFCTARVIEADVRGRRPYLVTEYVDGPSLHDVLISGGPLPGSHVEALAVGVAAALTAIHAAGVIHRDLKPSNVMLSGFGPKVIDFGVARALDATAGPTESGVVVGSPGWMAPEQLHGMATAASDVYVWGLLVARAGTRWRPEAELRVTRPASSDLAMLPANLATLVTAALHPDPRHRPSARELLLRLCGSTDPEPVRTATAVLTRPGNPPYSSIASSPAARRRGGGRASAPASGRRTRRPRRWFLRKRVLLLAAVTTVVVISSANRPPEQPQNLPPLTARDGLLEFVVMGMECGKPSLGEPGLQQRRAQGQLCTVRLRVRNFGDEARRVHVGSQRLHDGTGRVFSADDAAWVYLPEAAPFLQQEINPGNEVTATLVYDIAPDAVPKLLEVHDSPLSGGASITL